MAGVNVEAKPDGRSKEKHQQIKGALIEDDVYFAETRMEYYAEAGMTFDNFPDSGDDTLDLIQSRGPYDIYIVDTNLGKYSPDGIKCTQLLVELHRQMGWNPPVIIGTSALGSEYGPKTINEMNRIYQAMGATLFIPKDEGPQSIIDTIRSLLG